jgi:hypothetical protein
MSPFLYNSIDSYAMRNRQAPSNSELKQGIIWVLSTSGGEPPASIPTPDHYKGKYPKVKMKFFYIFLIFIYSNVQVLS